MNRIRGFFYKININKIYTIFFELHLCNNFYFLFNINFVFQIILFSFHQKFKI